MKAILVDAHRLGGYNCGIEKKIFEKAGETFVIESCKTEDEIIARCSDADVILNVLTNMSPKSINSLRNCKALIRYGIGFDSFDFDAATAKGIMICNIPDYCVPEVATHATAMILAISRQLLMYTLDIRRGFWEVGKGMKMRRPTNQTVAIIGFGNIGRAVAAMLKPIGFNLIVYDPYVSAEDFAREGVKGVSLQEAFQTADIVTLHTPLNKETTSLVDKAAIDSMKDGVIIINTSRGPVVDENALVEGLRSGKVAGAALDVAAVEPFTLKEHPFFEMDNVILTPHAAFKSNDSFRALCERVAETAVQVMKGEVPKYVANRKELGL